MPFITPLALAGLIFIPAVIAMYMLKLRRDQAVVPSTLLWSRLLTDVEANAPWQRLRRSPLLLLQLLLVIALVLLAARPFLERPAGLARDIVLVMDTSASMAATDVAPNRLAAARAAALDALGDLPTGGRVSVIAVDRSARIVVNDTSDISRVRQALDELRPAATRGDLGDALELASKLAARSGDAQILVATDAALATVPTTKVDAPIRVLPVGRERKNQAIVALAVRTSPSAVTRSVFISVANLDIESAQRRIEVWGDDRLLEARDVDLDGQARSDVVIDDVPADVAVVEIRLVGRDPASGTPADQLAIDDRAWAVMPATRTRLVLLVGEGDPYLETALSYLPNVELYGVEPADYGPASQRTDGRAWDLTIFESNLPTTLPTTPILAIAPPRTSPLGVVSGTVKDPGIGSLSPDEPVLRYVDLSTTHISQAQLLTTPDWARTVIPGPKGAPLLYTGVRAGLPTAVLAFEPRRSDLPLQVAFPILLSNLTGELLGGSAAPTDAVAPGTPVNLTIPSGATGVTVTRPDGTTTDLVASAAGGASVSYVATELPGIYTVTPIRSADASPNPSASGAPSPNPTALSSGRPSTAPSGSPAASAVPIDPNAPVRFAVDLFDVGESNIAPGSVAAIEGLGTAPDPSSSPGNGAPTDRPTTRDELWLPIVLLVLIGLCVEWALYHRDAVVRMRRSLVARFGPPPGGTA
jgi:VWA domain-containing protein/aerotolerance regulator-like protein